MQRLVLLAAAALFCTAADAPKITVAGGHSYAFPPAAFMDGEVEYGRQGSLLLQLTWPEMQPLTPEEASAWPQPDTIRILTVNGAPVDGDGIPDSELLAGFPRKLAIARDMSVKEVEGPQNMIRMPQLDPEPAPAGSAVPGGGMLKIRTEPGLGDGIKDVFAQEPLVQLRSFIVCDRADKMVVDPQCSQQFVAANMDFKVGYRRALVPQWQHIEAETIAFFHNHEVRP